ncbi:MAG: signal peptidase I [Ignavibacteriae bacterium]|nr:signal peptidase I [Ignavibacteriota bacterium]
MNTLSKEKGKVRKETKRKADENSAGEKLWSWIKTLVGAIIVVTIINGLAIASFVVPTPSMERTVMTGDFLFVNKFIYGPSTPQVIPFFNIPLPFFRFPAFREPQKGDVIVFIFPGNRDEVEATEFQYYLKRCVATAGDTLEIRDNHLFVNHKEYKLAKNGFYDSSVPDIPSEKFQTYPYGKNYTRDNYGPIRIPKEGDIIPISMSNLHEWAVFIQREGHKISSDGYSIYIDGNKATTYKVQRDYCFGMGDNRDHSLDSRYWGFIPKENIVGTPVVVYWSWDTNMPLAKFFDKIASTRWTRIGTIIR